MWNLVGPELLTAWNLYVEPCGTELEPGGT